MACMGANRLPQHDSSPFPLKLMEILDHNRHGDIICWLPHGRGFIIRDKKRFEIEVMPHYFKESKYTSFTRRLNRWNFTIQAHGHKKASYFHPKFVRGNPIQCLDMKPVSQVRKNASWSALGSSNATIATLTPAATDDGQHEKEKIDASGTSLSKNKSTQAIASDIKSDAGSYQKEKIKTHKPSQSARPLFSHQPNTSGSAPQAPNMPSSQEQQLDQNLNSNKDLGLNRAIMMSEQARQQQFQHSRDVINSTGSVGAQQARQYQLQQFQDLTHPRSLQGPESLLNTSRYPNMMHLMQQNIPTGPSPFNPNMGFRYGPHSPSSLHQRGLVPSSLPHSPGRILNSGDSNVPAISQQFSRREMPGFSGFSATVFDSGAGGGQFPYSYANLQNLAMFPPSQLNIARNRPRQHLLASLQQNHHQQHLIQSSPLHRQEVYRQVGMTNLPNTPLEQGVLQSTHPQRTVDQYRTATAVVGDDNKDTCTLNNLPQERRSSSELSNAGQLRKKDSEGSKSQE